MVTHLLIAEGIVALIALGAYVVQAYLAKRVFNAKTVAKVDTAAGVLVDETKAAAATVETTVTGVAKALDPEAK